MEGTQGCEDRTLERVLSRHLLAPDPCLHRRMAKDPEVSGEPLGRRRLERGLLITQ